MTADHSKAAPIRGRLLMTPDQIRARLADLAAAAHADDTLLTLASAVEQLAAPMGVGAATARKHIRNALADDAVHGLLMLVPDGEWFVKLPHRLRLPRLHLRLSVYRAETSPYARFRWEDLSTGTRHADGPGQLVVVTTAEQLAKVCQGFVQAQKAVGAEASQRQQEHARVAWEQVAERQPATVELLRRVEAAVPGLEVRVHPLRASGGGIMVALTAVDTGQTGPLMALLEAGLAALETGAAGEGV